MRFQTVELWSIFFPCKRSRGARSGAFAVWDYSTKYIQLEHLVLQSSEVLRTTGWMVLCVHVKSALALTLTLRGSFRLSISRQLCNESESQLPAARSARCTLLSVKTPIPSRASSPLIDEQTTMKRIFKNHAPSTHLPHNPPISLLTHFSNPPLAIISCTFGGNSPTF